VCVYVCNDGPKIYPTIGVGIPIFREKETMKPETKEEEKNIFFFRGTFTISYHRKELLGIPNLPVQL